ncbi:DUF58 domain-containing protein [Rubritalea tangerina]|uniref:DUF58 domain-containing protein n=1 Tax=Rubritalea tangerina TaxID=430798 RepID=A0ABW4ZE43_9BACT
MSVLLVVVTVLAAALAVWNLRGVEVDILQPPRVSAGKRFPIQMVLRNRRQFFDSVGLRLYVYFDSDEEMVIDAPWVATQAEVVLDEGIAISQRACLMSVRYRLCSDFPFGLFHREVDVDYPLAPPLIVYPRKIIPRELLVQGVLSSAQSEHGMSPDGELGEMKGLRPWQSGDSAKHIHWPASARSVVRGHDLRVREYDPPGMYVDRCAVLFHSYGRGGAMLREDRFERAIAFLAGSLEYLYSLGIRTSLYADFLAWSAYDCGQRTDLIEINAMLSQAQRSLDTEEHELHKVVQSLDAKQAVIVISDLELESWEEAFDSMAGAILVDIKQVQFKRRGVRSAKEVRDAS